LEIVAIRRRYLRGLLDLKRVLAQDVLEIFVLRLNRGFRFVAVVVVGDVGYADDGKQKSKDAKYGNKCSFHVFLSRLQVELCGFSEVPVRYPGRTLLVILGLRFASAKCDGPANRHAKGDERAE